MEKIKHYDGNGIDHKEKAKKEIHIAKGIRRYILIGAGSLSLALGTLGIALPFLPTFPFYLLTLICFSKSSVRLRNWFLSAKLYKKYMEPILQKHSVTWKTKLSMVLSITLFMSLGFYLMKNIPAGRILLAAIWFAHMLYFIFGVKTAKDEKKS